jgi:ELWxxDGT repeat protein
VFYCLCGSQQKNKKMKKIIYTICLLLTGLQLQAQISTFDIYPGTKGSQPDEYTSFNGNVYFSASDPNYGRELWKTDGTAAGTSLVKDVYGGVLGSNPTHLFVANNVLYFTANDGVHGNELWMTDGTITKLAKDFNVGSVSSDATALIEYNGNLIVWYKDGNTATIQTLDGAWLLSNYNNEDNIEIKPTHFYTAQNGNLIYAAALTNSNYELYSWDGVSSPQLVADIDSSVSSGLPSNFLQLNDTIYYSADNGVHGRELFATNVNNAGTKMVADINVGVGSSDAFVLDTLNRQILVVAYNGTNEIMGKIDATGGFVNNGLTSVKVAQLNQTSNSTAGVSRPRVRPEYSRSLIVKRQINKIHFPANNGINGIELYSWDGTNPPTLEIDYNTGTASSNPSDLFVYKDHLFFNATDATGKTNLVMYNGNTWGNVKDSASGSSISSVKDFVGNDDWSGVELNVQNGGTGSSNISDYRLFGKVKDTSGNEEPGSFAKLSDNGMKSLSSKAEMTIVKIQGSTDSLNVVTAWNSNSNNTFTAQLSNKDGSFANPTNIGTMSSNKGGKMAVRYPTNIPQSVNYRVRLIASSPADTSLPSNKKIALIPASFINSCNNINPTVDSLYGDYAVSYTYWQIDSLGLPVSSFAPVTVNDTLRFAKDATNVEMMTIKSLNKTSGIINISQMSFETEMLQLNIGLEGPFFKVGKRLPAITRNSTYAHISTSPTSGLPSPPPYQVTPVDLNPFGFSFLSSGIPNMVSGPIQLPSRGHLIIEPKRNIGTYAGNRYELQVRGSNRVR